MANSDAGTAAATLTVKSISADMVYEILSRVSARSVLRLKSVCKLWCSVAENPYFIYLHLERSKSRRSPQIILHADTGEADRRHNGIILLSHRWFPKLILWSPYTDSCLFNTRPCNGLICLYDHYTDIRLCNPTTRKLQVLPDPTRGGRQFCCLGFVPATKQYKVLRIFPIDPVTSESHLGWEVLTVGGSSWRRVGELQCLVRGKGVNLDGSIYLIAIMCPSMDAYLIRFDLTAENLDMVKLPDMVQHQVLQLELLDLVLRGGKLCLVKRVHPGRLFALTLRGDYKNNIWDPQTYQIEYTLSRNTFDSASFVGDEGLLAREANTVYFSRGHFVFRDDEVYHSIGFVTDVYEFEESLVPLEKSAMLVQSRLRYSRLFFLSAASRTVRV